MVSTKVKSDVGSIAKHLSLKSTYVDAMYELYVRMKIAKGKEDICRGRVLSHNDVKRK